jgi:glycosyltransferase involved in cell wall biosynthesis
MTKLPITVAIPIKNEERNLPACLKRLDDFQTVLAVDSGSTDRSLEILADHGVPVLQFAWAGGFPKKRNWLLMQDRLDTPWVLFLDADEHITPEFVSEVRRAIDGTDKVGFWLNYTTHFMGRVLNHGLPQRKLALFRVGAGLYERIEDPGWSTLDMEVHEHPVLDGPVGEIAAKIDHLDFRGIEHFIARHNSYSSWEAFRYKQLVARRAEAWDQLTARQRRKYGALVKWWLAPSYFLMNYVLRLGFLDGRAGLDYALLKMAYFQNIRLKIQEIDSGKAR